MRRVVVALTVLAPIGLACAPGRAGAGPASTPVAASPAPSPSPSPQPEEPVDFVTRVLPVLQERCSPCHFAGGRMYEQLPFDREGTIRFLGPAVLGRLKDPVDVELLREFLGKTE